MGRAPVDRDPGARAGRGLAAPEAGAPWVMADRVLAVLGEGDRRATVGRARLRRGPAGAAAHRVPAGPEEVARQVPAGRDRLRRTTADLVRLRRGMAAPAPQVTVARGAGVHRPPDSTAHEKAAGAGDAGPASVRAYRGTFQTNMSLSSTLRAAYAGTAMRSVKPEPSRTYSTRRPVYGSIGGRASSEASSSASAAG